MDFLNKIWEDPDAKIWYRSLISFIIFCIISVWVYISIITKTVQPFDWTHIALLVSGLGLPTVQNYLQNKDKKE